jgi:two-component system chemotaxis response regulator CheY
MALRLKPMLICLDHMMPKLSGIDVLQQIRPQLANTAILMVTGNTERDTVQSAIQAGANGYIVKPFNAARVFEAMGKALSALGQSTQNTDKTATNY